MNDSFAGSRLHKFTFIFKIIASIRYDENEDLAKTVEKIVKKMQGKNNQTSVL